MRSLVLSCLLAGCSLAPAPAPAIAAPAPLECTPVERAILGTWVRGSAAMEVRPDGVVVRDNVEQYLRWTAPGRAAINSARGHEDHTFALPTAAQLLDVGSGGDARFWTRVSPVPAYPERCFELRGSIVGEWSDGTLTESFARDGAYVRGDVHGNWAIVEPGVLEIAQGLVVRRYHLALASPDLLVSAPIEASVDRDPRGSSTVLARVR